MRYDYIIAGAGLSGSVFARELAEKGYKILVVERRNHVAGNLYDEKKEGVHVHCYGPHIFHTSNEIVHQYVQRFSRWMDYRLRCEVVMDSISTPSPFNFKTIDQFYSTEEAQNLKITLAKNYPDKQTVTVIELLNSDDADIRAFAQMLYDKDYSLYTAKQWGVNPQDIDVSVLKRVPIRLDYEERYFTDKYEYLPNESYTKFIENILNHTNITIKTSVNILDYIDLDFKQNKIIFSAELGASSDCTLVFTGAIDELFNYQYGYLPYRSLKFKYDCLNVESFQNAAVVAYPSVPDYTRITEYTKLPVQKIKGKTVIAYEYPINYEESINMEPYYPIPTENSNNLYLLYKRLADSICNLILCGRLAEYKYYNMDQAIASVLSKVKHM